MMDSVWGLGYDDLLSLIHSDTDRETEGVDIGDITVVCHTSNQSNLLQPLIDSVKVITDKIIILNDCSQDDTVVIAIDNGCEVYNIPEGWLYTHGFGKLIEFQVSVCKSEYHFQIDTGETIYVPKNCPKISGNIVGNVWLNEQTGSNLHGSKQTKFNRLLSTRVPVNFPAYIHGAPTGIGGVNTTKSEIVILHGDSSGQQWSDYYKDRRNRLYYKLLKKGFDDRRLENNWWYEYYSKNSTMIEGIITDTENRIGTLVDTTEEITKVI